MESLGQTRGIERGSTVATKKRSTKAPPKDSPPIPASGEPSVSDDDTSGDPVGGNQSTEPASSDPLRDFWTSMESEEAGGRQLTTTAAREALAGVLQEHEIAREYNILLLYDEGSLVRSDADNIYRAIRLFPESRDVLLLLHSTGGDVGSAYLISQLCREHAKDRFSVVIPRRAKSAATLLACGADQIHLGSMSELGPIDPQIGGYPALGLGNALRHIAELVAEFPDSADMFASYLAHTIPPIDLGYYERVAESAVQYAERLLRSRTMGLERSAAKIAHTLVYSYKDHGFVIDKHEAAEILGSNTIVTDSPEYDLGNALYDRLSVLGVLARYRGYRFYWVGSPDSDCNVYPIQE